MLARFAAPLIGLALLGGCGPSTRYVAASTGTVDQIKFLYVEPDGDQGVIKCQRTPDGTLSACRQMQLTLIDE
jgi:hypothetical protein